MERNKEGNGTFFFVIWNGTRTRMWNGMEWSWIGIQSVIVSFPVHTHLLMISIWEGLSEIMIST